MQAFSARLAKVLKALFPKELLGQIVLTYSNLEKTASCCDRSAAGVGDARSGCTPRALGYGAQGWFRSSCQEASPGGAVSDCGVCVD